MSTSNGREHFPVGERKEHLPPRFPARSFTHTVHFCRRIDELCPRVEQWDVDSYSVRKKPESKVSQYLKSAVKSNDLPTADDSRGDARLIRVSPCMSFIPHLYPFAGSFTLVEKSSGKINYRHLGLLYSRGLTSPIKTIISLLCTRVCPDICDGRTAAREINWYLSLYFFSQVKFYAVLKLHNLFHGLVFLALSRLR